MVNRPAARLAAAALTGPGGSIRKWGLSPCVRRARDAAPYLRPREVAKRHTPMAGHSAFKNIMHKKGRKDAARAKLFAKLAREITVAAKSGMPDPDKNPRLRLAVAPARAPNKPQDNNERAIKKG